MTHPLKTTVHRPLRAVLWLLIASMVLGTAVPHAPAADKKRRTKRGRKSRATATDNSPRDYRSRNFLVHTDLPKKEAEALLKRLETMLRLISKYWGAPCRKTIECYVVKDIKNWNADKLNPTGLQHILAGGGVTISQALGIAGTDKIVDANAVVYAVSGRGTPLHEAVHAYCALTFGRTGPTWYSEGMADMGAYWQERDSSVNCEPIVVEYLTKTEIKSLNAIVNGQEFTGDSWQNYAWRWALCHLLANNKNYAARFRPLGLSLLNKKGASFNQIYGPMAKEISFEYKFFIEHLARGYRADLCGFDWKRRFRKPRGSEIVKAKVLAKQGWQPSGLMVESDTEYEFSASGGWKLSKEGPLVDCDGTAAVKAPQPATKESQKTIAAAETPPESPSKPSDEKPESAESSPDDEKQAQPGQLMGIIMTDDEFEGYQLSEPFELGRFGSFTPPKSGKLFIRCYDAWNKLANNSGKVSVQLKVTGHGKPLKEPPVLTAKPTKRPRTKSSKKKRRSRR